MDEKKIKKIAESPDVEHPTSFPSYTPKLAKKLEPTKDELNGLFGRNFKANPKPLTYRGKPIDNGRFLNAMSQYIANGLELSEGFSKPMKVNDKEIIYGDPNYGDEPLSVAIDDDGSIRLYDMGREYDRYDNVDDLVNQFGFDYFDEAYDNDKQYYDDLDESSPMYDSYMNWRR